MAFRCFSSWIERGVQAELNTGWQKCWWNFWVSEKVSCGGTAIYRDHGVSRGETYPCNVWKILESNWKASESLQDPLQRFLYFHFPWCCNGTTSVWDFECRVQVFGWNCNVCESRTFWLAVCNEEPGNFLEKPNKASLGGSWQPCRVHEVQHTHPPSNCCGASGPQIGLVAPSYTPTLTTPVSSLAGSARYNCTQYLWPQIGQGYLEKATYQP